MAADKGWVDLLGALPLAVVALDAAGRIIAWTGTAETVYGWTAEQVLGRPARDLLSLPITEDHERAVGAALARGERWSGTIPLRRRDGQVFHAFIVYAPLHDDEGRLAGLVGLSVDRTDVDAACHERRILEGLGVLPDRSARSVADEALRQSEERFAKVFDQGPLGGVIFDPDLRIVQTNGALDRMLGQPSGELRDRNVADVTHPDDHCVGLVEGVQLLAGDIDRFTVDKRYLRADGSAVDGRLHVSAVRDGQGRMLYGIAMIEDLTATRRIEEVHRRTIEAAQDAFVGVRADGTVTDWNGAAEALFGWSRHEAVGARLVDLVFPAADRPLYQERIGAFGDPTYDHVPPARIDLVAQHRSGRQFPVELSLVVVTVDGEAHLRGFFRDVTERHAHERDLADHALHDQLTGLANRTLLMDRLERALDRGGHGGADAVAVLLVNIDRFRDVNDRFGRDVGDALLAAVARRLRATVDPVATAARYGADLFAVVYDRIDDPAPIEQQASRLRDAFGRPVVVGSHRIEVELSIGIARSGDTASTGEELLRQADIAMHHAKLLGGGRVEAATSLAWSSSAD